MNLETFKKLMGEQSGAAYAATEADDQEQRLRAEARCVEIDAELDKPEWKLVVASAYRDAEGWELFNVFGDLIEEWPADWPAKVNADFLKAKGIEVA